MFSRGLTQFLLFCGVLLLQLVFLVCSTGHFSNDVEIDECAQGTSGCQYQCVDTPDSFECRCPDAYKLDKNGRDCSRIECGVPNFRNCSNAGLQSCSDVLSSCINNTDHYYLNSTCQLSCNESDGYVLHGPDNITCTNSSKWDDETAKCLCDKKVGVTLSHYEIPEDFNKDNSDTNMIDVSLKIPACQPVHNHTIKLKLYGRTGPPFELEIKDENKIKVHLLIGRLVNVTSAAPSKQIKFAIIITHGTSNEVQQEEFVLTINNVPEAPTIICPGRFSVFDTDKIIKTFLIVTDFDYDRVTCTIDHPMLELIATKSNTVSSTTTRVGLQVTDGKTFGDFGEEYESPYNFNNSKIKCTDDSAQKMTATATGTSVITINDRYVDIDRIVADPNETNNTDVYGRLFRITAYNEDGVQSTNCEIIKVEPSGEFNWSTYFEVDEDNILKVISNKIIDAGTYNITLKVKDTHSNKFEDYNATIVFKDIEIATELTPKDIIQTFLIIIGIVVIIVFVAGILIYNIRKKHLNEKRNSKSVQLSALQLITTTSRDDMS